MRTVVVGGCGLIGSRIVYQLLAENHEVRILERKALGYNPWCGDAEIIRCDVTSDKANLPELFDGAEEVYHMAGVLGTSELENQIPEAVRVNVLGAVRVFDAAVKAGVQRVFYPSKPNVWRNVYTITKEASEQLAAVYNQQGKIKITSLRLFNAYGEGQSLVPVRKIVPTFAAQAHLGLPIQVWGDGEQTVDLVYTDDIANTAVEVTHRGLTGVYDYGRGVPLTVNAVAELVNRIAGNKAGVVHLPMRPGETPNTKLVADLAPLEAALGHKLTFDDFEETMGWTVDSYYELGDEPLKEALKYYGIV
jgi:UDP-glucose 4-epimerase